MYKEISRCRMCGNTALTTILNLGLQALDGVFPKRVDDIIESGPLELMKCDSLSANGCGLVQLRHSFEPGRMYGNTYGYRSGLNPSMVDHLRAKARAIRNIVALSPGDLVLDIGSNDGTLLRAFESPGVTLVGMDPSGSKFSQFYPTQATLVPDFFSAARFRHEFGSRRPKVVTSIAMFYDLEAPLEFVQDIIDILADDGVWVFEQSYVLSMLDKTAYDTICHEHLEYYGLRQIAWMAERAGLKILDVELNESNGGSFSVVVAKASSPYTENFKLVRHLLDIENTRGLDSPQIYADFGNRVSNHREALLEQLTTLRSQGQRVFGYGASTKGNVLLQFGGITSELLPYIAEINPDKFGSFTPHTLIPIISETEARALHPSVFLVLPWHFRQNIIQREEDFLALGGKLLFPLPRIEMFEHGKSACYWA